MKRFFCAALICLLLLSTCSAMAQKSFLAYSSKMTSMSLSQISQYRTYYVGTAKLTKMYDGIIGPGWFYLQGEITTGQQLDDIISWLLYEWGAGDWSTGDDAGYIYVGNKSIHVNGLSRFVRFSVSEARSGYLVELIIYFES